MQQDKKYKQLEEAILKATDLLIEKAKSQGEKMVFELDRKACLKLYEEYKNIADKTNY